MREKERGSGKALLIGGIMLHLYAHKLDHTDHIWELFSLALIFGFTLSSQSSLGIGVLDMV